MRAEHDGQGDELVDTHLRPAHFVPETKHLTPLLREMQEHKFHLSVVVDEYGSTVGLVTLEDLIEELVGEIVDEYDVEEPAVERLTDGCDRGHRAHGGRRGRRPARRPPARRGPGTRWAASCFDLAGHVPAEGEAVEIDGFRLVAERVQGRRIDQVRIDAGRRPAAGRSSDGG